jgi:hypothetical protein
MDRVSAHTTRLQDAAEIVSRVAEAIASLSDTIADSRRITARSRVILSRSRAMEWRDRLRVRVTRRVHHARHVYGHVPTMPEVWERVGYERCGQLVRRNLLDQRHPWRELRIGEHPLAPQARN